MHNSKVVVTEKPVKSYSGHLLVFFVSVSKKKTIRCHRLVKEHVKSLVDSGDFKGKKEETLMVFPQNSSLKNTIFSERVLYCGIGPFEKKLPVHERQELMRRAAGAVAKMCAKNHINELLLVPPDYLGAENVFYAEQIVEGVLLADYRFLKYKKNDSENEKFVGIDQIALHGAKQPRALRNAAKQAQYSSFATYAARDMANEPGNKWTPQQFADYAEELKKRFGLSCKILEKSHMKKAGMGGILAVNQGSATAPKLVVLEYKPKRFKKTIALVGKGITFDSGGISIKPAAGMQDMKYDMCGGAAVLAAMQSVAQEKPDVRVVALVPSTDNMSGSSAIKPGDIITHYNGVTSEIINTDAEGRLILADALAYGIKHYKPDYIVDLATLTGAVIISLGHHRSGLMSNNDGLAQALLDAGERCGEPAWRLPLGSDYSKQIDSEVADIKNIGGRPAGAITAGAYLEKFVGQTPWAHLDIAGTAWEFTKKSYIPKGPSGIGVRTLIEFIRNWKSVGK